MTDDGSKASSNGKGKLPAFMLTLREFIRLKVQFMGVRPEMVAGSTESFSQQIMLLLEMYGGISILEASAVIHDHRFIYASEVRPDWAKAIVESALRLIDDAPVTNRPGWRTNEDERIPAGHERTDR